MILCAGEALIDMLPGETRTGAQAFAPTPGGAVFNTAIALGRLEAPAGLLTGLSTDMFGERLARTAAEAGVDTRPSIRAPRPTTLAFVTLEGGHASYLFYDENTALRALTPEQMPPLPAGTQALFVGGISLVAEPCGSAFEHLALGAAGQCLMMIDPNIRPGFITDEPAYRTRLARLFGAADVIKLSDEDMAWLGTTPDALLEGGAALVTITRGAEGVDVHMPGGSFHVPAAPAKVVDTVGAGDTFNAGLLAGLAEAGLLAPGALRKATAAALRPAVELGTRAAAVTVSRAGANPPTRAELEALP